MRQYLIPIFSLMLILTSCQSKENKLNEIVNHSFEDVEIGGYLYVEKGGDILYDGVIQTSSPLFASIDDSTKVYLASLTKLFTEIAVLRLYEQGKIDLNSPITENRESFKPTFGQKIKIIDLIKMTSGLPREISQDTMPMVQFNDNNLVGPFLDTIPDFDLLFEPGAKEKYSNLNYWILGAIIENITGKNIQDAFDQLIFRELGMNSSGFFNKGKPIQNGFTYINDKWQLDTTTYVFRYASGGCYSTIKDLKKLSKSLSIGNFLKSSSLKLLKSSENKIEVYGSLPGNSNMYIQDFENHSVIISLNIVGLRDLSVMTKLKNGIEKEIGATTQKKTKRVVKLDPIQNLNDSISIEKSLKVWIRAVETKSGDEIFKVIKNVSVESSMSKEDRTWEALSQLNSTLPNFRALGFRWVKDQKPEGIEVWFGSDKKGKLAIRWLLNEETPTLVENIFIMPDDMTWLGKSY